MKSLKSKLTPYLFILPHLILFVIFFAIPVFTGVVISFFKWDLLSKPVFVGFSNYNIILFDKSSFFYGEFWNALFNTFKFVIFSVPLLTLIPLLIALGLNVNVKGSAIFQGIFYFPSLLSVATVCLTWIWMFDQSNGLVNHILHTSIAWTINQPFAWIGIVVLSVWWGIGINMIIFLAGIADIPVDQYEAASLDGANALQKFLVITLPGLKNQILYAIITTTIASFNVYGQPLMVTHGGPTKSTNVVMMLIQSLAFGAGVPQAGLASAMAVVVALIIMIVSIFQFKLSSSSQ